MKKLVFKNGSSIEFMEFPDGSRHCLIRGFDLFPLKEVGREDTINPRDILGVINGNPSRADSETVL